MDKLVELTKGQVAIVDAEDFDLVSAYSWHLSVNRYAAARINKTRQFVLMHRLILNAASGQLVDHIDGNGLNNKRANLRIVSELQNSFGNRSRSPRRALPRGVNRLGKKFSARINFRRQEHYLGVFVTEEEAAEAYRQASLRFHGDYSYFKRVAHS